jgi:hypothetical protein
MDPKCLFLRPTRQLGEFVSFAGLHLRHFNLPLRNRVLMASRILSTEIYYNESPTIFTKESATSPRNHEPSDRPMNG